MAKGINPFHIIPNGLATFITRTSRAIFNTRITPDPTLALLAIYYVTQAWQWVSD